MKHFGDITQLSGYTLPIVDVIVGGSPCQDLSVAGKREGLAGARSGLFMEQVRLVKEMRERDRLENGRSGFLCRPRYMVWENVPGAFNSNGGEDFRVVLEEIVKIAEPDAPDVPMPGANRWPKAGCLYSGMGEWSVAWRLHDSQFWGVPQRRKRIALVADFGGLSAPEVLFERKGLSRDPKPCGEEGQGAAARAEESTGNADDINISNILSFHQNASNEIHISNIAYTVGTDSNASGRQTPLLYENHSQDSRYKPLGEVCETVSAKYGTGGNNQPIVVDPMPFDTT